MKQLQPLCDVFVAGKAEHEEEIFPSMRASASGFLLEENFIRFVRSEVRRGAAGGTGEIREAGNLQHRSGVSVYLRGLDRHAEGCRSLTLTKF